MKENNNVQIETKKKKGPKMIVLMIIGLILIMLLGLQVFASTNGYGNVFFMIKNLVTTGTLSGEKEIFSDKDITLSYKSIDLGEGVSIQVNRMEVKENHTTIYLSVKSKDSKPLPLIYDTSVEGQKDRQIIGYEPENTDTFNYNDELDLSYEVKDDDIIRVKISNCDYKELRTLEINMQTREITVTGEADIEKISQIELKKYLGLFSALNNDINKSDALLYIAESIQNKENGFIEENAINEAKQNNTDRALKNAIIKEFYEDTTVFEFVNNPNLNAKTGSGMDVEVLKDLTGWEYDIEKDAYNALTVGEEVRYGKCLDIEDIKFEDGIYTVKYIYLLATSYDEDSDNLEELPQYESTIKLKRNEDALYSKYQVLSITDGKQIKEKVSQDIFKDADKLSIKDDIKDEENGKIAIIKLGESALKTDEKDGYYVYKDRWDNTYNIKKIEMITSKFIELGADNSSALFKCNIIYKDNNDNEKELPVAVIVYDKDNYMIEGTFDNYTGSTRYTKWVGLYEDGEDNHTHEYVVEKTPNGEYHTTLDGKHTLKCIYCGDEKQEPHNFDKWVPLYNNTAWSLWCKDCQTYVYTEDKNYVENSGYEIDTQIGSSERGVDDSHIDDKEKIKMIYDEIKEDIDNLDLENIYFSKTENIYNEKQIDLSNKDVLNELMDHLKQDGVIAYIDTTTSYAQYCNENSENQQTDLYFWMLINTNDKQPTFHCSIDKPNLLTWSYLDDEKGDFNIYKLYLNENAVDYLNSLFEKYSK